MLTSSKKAKEAARPASRKDTGEGEQTPSSAAMLQSSASSPTLRKKAIVAPQRLTSSKAVEPDTNLAEPNQDESIGVLGNSPEQESPVQASQTKTQEDCQPKVMEPSRGEKLKDLFEQG